MRLHHWIALGVVAAAPLGADASELRDRVRVKPGGTLSVRLDAGSLEVETHDDHAVEVDAVSSGLGSVRFELSSDGENATLEGRGSSWLGPLLGSGRVRVRVRVPEQYSLDARTGGGSIDIEELGGTARARTSGGSIAIDGARGPVELQTSGGSIRVESVVGDVTARTSGGSIDVSEVTGRIEVRTSGGPIRALDVGGPVLARTSGGSIQVRFSGTPEGEVRTSGGSIEAELPEDAGVDLEARTSGGRVAIDDDFEVQGRIGEERAEVRLNGGGRELKLSTSGGNVRVRAR